MTRESGDGQISIGLILNGGAGKSEFWCMCRLPRIEFHLFSVLNLDGCCGKKRWARSLDDALPILKAIQFRAGVYTRLVIHLEQWVWSYDEGWEREYYL